MLSEEDAAKVDMNRADNMTEKRVTLLYTLHYSTASKEVVLRSLLLNCYAASDAKPCTPQPQPTSNSY